LFDYKPFETWYEEGARDTYALAAERVAYQLATYQQPPLDPKILAALEDYVAQKKNAMPDAFV
jgi:trimethylamine--corrinoid protein Co-methyltransferase